MILPCIVCGATPQSVDDLTASMARSVSTSSNSNHPWAATVFRTRGHWGSTMFDPGTGGGILEITVCDNCVRVKAEAGSILHYQQQYREPEYEVRLWEGPNHPTTSPPNKQP